MATAKKATAKKATAKKATAKKVSKKTVARKVPAKKAVARKAIKRTLIEPTPGDKRYVRRNPEGEFKHEVDVGRSLSADKRSTAKKKVKPGQGDKGDVER